MSSSLPRRYLLGLALGASAGLQPLKAQGQVKAHAALTLLCADLPPFSIEGDARRPGALVELALAILKRAGWSLQPSFVPWPRAVHLAAVQPRTLLLPLMRTPERESKFNWIAKLASENFAFINLATAAPINTLDQARALRVGVLRSTPHPLALARADFVAHRVVLASSYEDLHRMLHLGMVDALYGSEQIHLYRSDVAEGALQSGLVLESADLWLAAGSGLTPAEKAGLHAAAHAVQQEKLAERLFKRYGLTAPMARRS